MATLSGRVPRALLQKSPAQLRTYASPSSFKRRTGIRDGEGASDVPGEQSTGRRRRDTAFLPMPTSQLTHPLFQPDHLSRLALQPFHPEIITPAVVSQALKFPHNDKDPFRIFGLPRNLLVEFRILSAPCSVVRNVTIDVVNRLDTASQASSANHRLVFTGATGCGKSVLLLQALQYCHARDWIVFYFPRAINLVNSTTTYAYDARTRLYQQATFAFQTLQRFLTVNSHRLDQLKTTMDVELERRATIPVGTPLSDLVRVGIKERALAPTILMALMEELQKQTEFPVLLAVDDFQAIYCKTKYRDPQFSAIKPYYLSMPRLLLEFASGQRQFVCFLPSLREARFSEPSRQQTSNSDSPSNLRRTLGVPPVSHDGPYIKRSSTLQTYSKGLERVIVPDALTVQEAMEVFDLWSQDNAMPSAPTDELFLSKYTGKDA
ncbi:mitochondrial ribosomal death-associated protein 3-domain-containing protein [Boletus reticuloceps]|uniref:Small ribosomal subunit protein mS29 n=1 Tax=Boletus reticuloceps TaxID=495285 RepID=A0A8I2YNN2_9AGAM|nr:mitochondrial ribosomal death-associated protein 3-domain-containing protein [Boletus reticuloceps]